MRRLDRIRPTELQEVLRIAAKCCAEDSAWIEQVEQRRAIFAAAEELGFSVEQLERAAVLARARRMARRRWHRRCRQAVQAALGLALVIGAPPLFSLFSTPMAEAPTRMVTVSPKSRSVAPAVKAPPAVPAGSFFPVNLRRHVNHGLKAPMLRIPGNDLSNLGDGIRRMGGVPFRLDGAIMVGPEETGAPGMLVSLPRQVRGIPVSRRADRLYFLQAAHFVFPQMEGVKIGTYIVRYSDGKHEKVPIRASIDIADWWENGTEAAKASVAWYGECPAASRARTRVRLFLREWKNPRPKTAIRSLEMTTGDQPAGMKVPTPFLVGVTAMVNRPIDARRGRLTQGGPVPSDSNLLTNGSFEVEEAAAKRGIKPFGLIALSGWRIIRGTVDIVPASYWQPPPEQGEHSLDLAGTPGAATIEQRFVTRPGAEYQFSGWLSHNPDDPSMGERQANVYIDGVLLTQLRHGPEGTSREEMHWERFTHRFRAAGKRTTLRLTNLGGPADVCGVVLDGLMVNRIHSRH